MYDLPRRPVRVPVPLRVRRGGVAARARPGARRCARRTAPRRSSPDDLVFFPPGPSGAHKVTQRHGRAPPACCMFSQRRPALAASAVSPTATRSASGPRDKAENVMVRRGQPSRLLRRRGVEPRARHGAARRRAAAGGGRRGLAPDARRGLAGAGDRTRRAPRHGLSPARREPVVAAVEVRAWLPAPPDARARRDVRRPVLRAPLALIGGPTGARRAGSCAMAKAKRRRGS